jgi:hypothetical protein
LLLCLRLEDNSISQFYRTWEHVSFTPSMIAAESENAATKDRFLDDESPERLDTVAGASFFREISRACL